MDVYREAWNESILIPSVVLAEQHYSVDRVGSHAQGAPREEHCNDRQNPTSLVQPRGLSHRRHDTAAVAAGYRTTASHGDGSRLGSCLRRGAHRCDLVPEAARALL